MHATPRRWPILASSLSLGCVCAVALAGAVWFGSARSAAQAPQAAPVAQDYAVITVHAPVSTVRPDYEPYARFMRAFTTAQAGRRVVAYDVVQSSGREFLDGYIDYLAQFPIDQLSAADQRAYWLNLHNLLVVQAVAQERRRSNLAAARGTGQAPGPLWSKTRVQVRGLDLSIEDIERRVVLARWPEPTSLYGLYQGAAGGPGLPEKAFEGESASAALEAAGQAFLSDRSMLRVKGGEARVSPFYAWYADAAGLSDEAALLAHLKAAATGRAAKGLAEVTAVKADLAFDYRADEFIMREAQLPPSSGYGQGAGGGSGGS